MVAFWWFLCCVVVGFVKWWIFCGCWCVGGGEFSVGADVLVVVDFVI